MNYTKIEKSKVYFRLSSSDNWKLISDIIGDDLITIEDDLFRHDTDELGLLLVSELKKSIKDK